MNALVAVVMTSGVVLAGIYLSMRCVAALYRVVDLGYAFGREKWRIARGLAGWGGATLLLFTLLPAPFERVFAISLLAYASLYVALWSVIRVLLTLRWRRVRQRSSALDDGGHAHAARGTDGYQPPS